MLRLRSIFVGRLGHFCSVGQRTSRRTTVTAEWRVALAGLRPGNRPGGERHSRSGEGGRGGEFWRGADLNILDLEEIANALASQTGYEHRWLINARTGQVAFRSAVTGIDGQTPVHLDELNLV